ncbi:hypothetical protein A3A46_00900 [Candidatus Roizmanbacteria bacterium RIFCSPLOWO2_01_FULL_37_13]|uniref:Type II toxin-antitoxin system mRNA interferase toxin, RelE/StbE family n=1 Tax=Candidatus Roizmanbacteria bacterium RIFCSPHIGHO2_02_FULL_38_11 TaxID=1802039 RepID=A0A1F7H114_9BACT|nr:MAG: hypothetical protein A3C25_02710 [Candidatus Roizmanbacteria bacterium RIFCSPHIGHO2_02_FULL_38_11]OGK41245.1 MAG: hypothetical protein A3A46_00900 [Candidatus Roizmanbacteria bacterium RIFCSPLOWO2_01_FULL_37_13]
MEIDYAPRFIKKLRKTPKKITVAFRERLEIFIKNKYSPILNNHQLTGQYSGLRSINITGDWRAIYKEIDKNTIYFVELGTHSELYK